METNENKEITRNLVREELKKIESIGGCPTENIKIGSDLGIHVMANIIDDTNVMNRFSDTKFIDNVCLSYNHSFGLMSEEDKQKVRFECKEWMRAIKNNEPYNR